MRASGASWPLVRKARSAGSPVTADVTGSPMCQAGIQSRAGGCAAQQRFLSRAQAQVKARMAA